MEGDEPMMAWTTCEACGWDCPDTGDEVVLCDECRAEAEEEARRIEEEELDYVAWAMVRSICTVARMERENRELLEMARRAADSDEPPF